MPISLFVAFAQQDASYANTLIPALRNAGYLVATDDGTQGTATSGFDSHLLNQLVQGDAFVLLLSPATHDDSRAVAASNLAYSLWLQGTIQYFIPVMATPLPSTALGGLLSSGDVPSSGDEFLARFDLLDGTDVPEKVAERIGHAIDESAGNDTLRRSPPTSTPSPPDKATGEIVTDVRGIDSAGQTTPLAGDAFFKKQAQGDQPQAPASSDADDDASLDLLQAVSEDEERAYAETQEPAPVDQEESERADSAPTSTVEESPASGKPKPADAVSAPPDIADHRAQEPVTGAPPPPDGVAAPPPQANIGAPPPPPPASVAAPMAPPQAPPPGGPGYPPPPAPGAPPASPYPQQPGYGEASPAWEQSAQPYSAPYPPPTDPVARPLPAYYPPPAPMPTPARSGGIHIPMPSLPERKREKSKESPAAEAGPALDVACTAYYPKEVAAQKWESLLVYLALDQPETLAAVAADAAERLVRQADRFRPASASGQSRLRKGAKLTIVPMLPGFEANPTSITTRWEEDVQRHEFRFRATTATPGQATNGYVSIFAGGLLFAEIPISIFVQQAAGRIDIPGGFASQVVRAYRKVFASYSHHDTDIVRMCRAAAEATGDRYLMDVTLLRSGQQWNDALLQAIAEADLFQLFWSKAAATSEHVANEWRYALELLPNRSGFIRPVYWSPELYPLPPELSLIHFERLDLVKLGWVRPQPFWRALFGRA